MTETKNYYKTPINCIDHTRCSSKIYDYDFNTYYKKESSEKGGSDIAKRIIEDMKFDEQCRRNLTDRKNGRVNYSWKRKEK